MPFTTLRPALICHSSKHADINTQQVHIPVGVHWCIPPTFLACSQADQQHVRSLHEVLLQMSPYFVCALHIEVNMLPLPCSIPLQAITQQTLGVYYSLQVNCDVFTAHPVYAHPVYF